MPNLTIAVISDLHIGHNARSKDLCPYPDTQQIDEKYLDKFSEFVQSENIQANYLIIPGDITGKAHPEEFQLASEAIVRIGAMLNVPEDKILFVPGNHDKDWNALPPGEEDTTGVRASQMYAPLSHQDWLFERILRRSPYYMLSDPCMAVWEFDDLLVVGYNSAQHDHRNAEIHHGLVVNASLDWLDSKLSTINTGSERIKLFLVHHHPIQYSDHLPDIPDFSVMTNAENLLNLLGKFKFDFLLHGHKHIPHFNTHVWNLNPPLVILGAGSFSNQLGASYNGHASNQFHLIEVEGRDNETACTYGLLKSWSYLSGHGWQQSKKNNGICHRIGFGTYTNPTILKNALRPIIQSRFTQCDFVKWSDLVSNDQKLGYLQPDGVVELLREIGMELGAEFFGDNPENAILLLPRGAH